MGFKIGYNVSRFPPMRNLEIPAYNFNLDHPDAKSKLKVPQLADGWTFAWCIGDYGGMEIMWSNKSVTSSSRYTAGGIDSIAAIKYRYNSWSFGAFFPISEDHRIGMTLDIGNVSIMKKKGPTDSDSLEFTNFFSKEMTLGSTIYLSFSFPMTDGLSLSIRPYYQLVWLISKPEYNGNDYYFNFNNIGVSASILIGKGGN